MNLGGSNESPPSQATPHRLAAYAVGSRISNLIGLPIGLSVIAAAYALPVVLSGEGLVYFLIWGAYGFAILGLILSFPLALRFGARYAVDSILANESLLRTSVKYSLVVNAVIWSVFAVLTVFQNGTGSGLLIGPPLILFAFSVGLSPFTIGLLVCHVIARKTKELVGEGDPA